MRTGSISELQLVPLSVFPTSWWLNRKWSTLGTSGGWVPQAGVVGGCGLGALSPLALGSFNPEIPSAWRGGANGLVAGWAGQ